MLFFGRGKRSENKKKEIKKKEIKKKKIKKKKIKKGSGILPTPKKRNSKWGHGQEKEKERKPAIPRTFLLLQVELGTLFCAIFPRQTYRNHR